MQKNKSRVRGRAIAKRPKRTTRVTVDFPIAQHRRLKARAALEGVTMQEFIRSRVATEDDRIPDEELNAIVKQIVKENKGALKRLADK